MRILLRYWHQDMHRLHLLMEHLLRPMLLCTALCHHHHSLTCQLLPTLHLLFLHTHLHLLILLHIHHLLTLLHCSPLPILPNLFPMPIIPNLFPMPILPSPTRRRHTLHLHTHLPHKDCHIIYQAVIQEPTHHHTKFWI